MAYRNNSYPYRNQGQSGNQNRTEQKPESPSNIGQKFHNPYTFIPFSGTPQHFEPILRTIDEVEKDRLSGVLELSVQTLRPLLTMQAEKKKKEEGSQNPKECHALKIGPDVIVPATAIRGMLRNLMTILTSGSLSNTNPNAWFCCGRDVQLGDGTGRAQFGHGTGKAKIPQKLFLARVERAGNSLQDGSIRIGECKLVPLDELEYAWRREQWKDNYPGDLRSYYKKVNGKVYFTYENGQPRPFNESRDAGKTRWQLKLSGKIQCKGTKKEALYAEDPTQEPITVSSPLWADYISRNINAGDDFVNHKELHRDDLIWLQPQNTSITRISDESQIKSLQWARWGKGGKAIHELLPSDEYLPDTDPRRTDHKVDFVTNLFGQVSDKGDKAVPCFAGRIRPENLVFPDASAKIPKKVELAPLSTPHPGCFSFYQKKVELAPLSTPHPGCFSFYQKKDEPKLRGYKVYRIAHKDEESWKYDEQPIYDKKGRAKPFKDNDMVQKADLLPPDQTGSLRIAFQALTASELALLCWVCSVNSWRLGGGKPLGLGLCHPEIKSIFILEDDGSIRTAKPEEFELDEPLRTTVENRTKIWEATQKPVSRVRYPRAAKRNGDSIQRGGHIWFSTFAAPKKSSSGQNELQTVRITDKFRNAKRLTGSALEGQWLPPFDQNDPEADVLYGWNVKLEPKFCGNGNAYNAFDQFDEEKDPLPLDSKHSHENNSLNREKRQANKATRLNPDDKSEKGSKKPKYWENRRKNGGNS